MIKVGKFDSTIFVACDALRTNLSMSKVFIMHVFKPHGGAIENVLTKFCAQICSKNFEDEVEEACRWKLHHNIDDLLMYIAFKHMSYEVTADS